MTLWGQEVVVNEKVIAESIAEQTVNSGAGLIDLVGQEVVINEKVIAASITASIAEQTVNRGAGQTLDPLNP